MFRTNIRARVWLLSIFFLLGAINLVFAEPMSCSYTTYKWNVIARKAVAFNRVTHPYTQLQHFEKDLATGCTVCEEDQAQVVVPGLKPFSMCRILASRTETALIELVEQGEPIIKIVAYRVGMTRGDVDSEGNRTQFSNHSFGIALDINDEQNGLYDQCISFGPECRLIKGGHWSPGQTGSWTEQSPVVREMGKLGMQWGGQIKGKQKDFMHFSPTGY